MAFFRAVISALVLLALAIPSLSQQMSSGAIKQKLIDLRDLSSDKRALMTKNLALQIRSLPKGETKTELAYLLGHLSTEIELSKDILQEVASTLALALSETPARGPKGEIDPFPYSRLAELVRYEGVKVDMSDAQFNDALKSLDVNDQTAEKLDFTLDGVNLKEIGGKKVTFSSLKGKIILLNFCASFSSLCAQEMPDLDAIYARYKSQGLVILTVSHDEYMTAVSRYINNFGYTYPIALDPKGIVAKQLSISTIPQDFVFDRSGKLVARSSDRRTQLQLFTMLAKAGLKPQ